MVVDDVLPCCHCFPGATSRHPLDQSDATIDASSVSLPHFSFKPLRDAPIVHVFSDRTPNERNKVREQQRLCKMARGLSPVTFSELLGGLTSGPWVPAIQAGVLVDARQQAASGTCPPTLLQRDEAVGTQLSNALETLKQARSVPCPVPCVQPSQARARVFGAFHTEASPVQSNLIAVSDAARRAVLRLGAAAPTAVTAALRPEGKPADPAVDTAAGDHR